MYFFKTTPSPDFTLHTERVDVWQFSLEKSIPSALSLLNDHEKERANRYYFPRHARRFTISRAMIRTILSRYAGTSAQNISFAYNSHGKPEIKNTPALQFNLSHSKDLALLAIGHNQPLGIDLEYFSPRPYIGIAKHIFSPKEVSALENEKKYLQPIAFFHLWTQKEALIKACGLGLSYPTKQFDLSHLPGETVLLTDPHFKFEWKINTFMPEPACCAAICYNPGVQELRYFKINPTDFL